MWNLVFLESKNKSMFLLCILGWASRKCILQSRNTASASSMVHVRTITSQYLPPMCFAIPREVHQEKYMYTYVVHWPRYDKKINGGKKPLKKFTWADIIRIFLYGESLHDLSSPSNVIQSLGWCSQSCGELFEKVFFQLIFCEEVVQVLQTCVVRVVISRAIVANGQHSLSQHTSHPNLFYLDCQHPLF